MSAENIGPGASSPKENQEPASRLLALVAQDMERVNQTILSRAASDVSMIPEVANHLISSGGKRLRPMLTLATAGLCGYAGAGHIKLAAAVEFMHTATLLHDDVVDESDMRRGKLAARMLWGNEASVLVGDFLLGQAFKMMVEVGSLPCLDTLSSAAAVIAEGEVMQLSAAKDTRDGEDDYPRGDPCQDGCPVRRRFGGRRACSDGGRNPRSRPAAATASTSVSRSSLHRTTRSTTVEHRPNSGASLADDFRKGRSPAGRSVVPRGSQRSSGAAP
jgi:hypothetical protein